ncbi:phage EaA protein [Klebsiella pneumoniae]|nr:phage EaA protein [Klebsiella pneumoniae]
MSNRIPNFGWNRLKLATLTYEQLAELEEQVKAEHACKNGIHLFDKAGQRKLDALSWAVYNKAEGGACSMTTDITELALMKGQKVEAPYYLAECTECGKMYSSSKLIESRNYFDGDADCYCPHCNAEDADIADLGSGEQPAAMAWNYQQARIDTLVEALERKEEQRANWFQMAQKLGELGFGREAHRPAGVPHRHREADRYQ